MEKIFFDNWESLFRTVVIGICSYLGLVLLLRGSGNRTLSQLNAFDLIVTVALGSTLATVILNKNVALADGLLALALLIILQFVISKLSVKFAAVRKFVNTEPRLLYFKGRYVKEALSDCRITEAEVVQAIRSEGIGTIEGVDAVVLETNGKFSVIKKLEYDGESVLKNVPDSQKGSRQ